MNINNTPVGTWIHVNETTENGPRRYLGSIQPKDDTDKYNKFTLKIEVLHAFTDNAQTGAVYDISTTVSKKPHVKIRVLNERQINKFCAELL